MEQMQEEMAVVFFESYSIFRSTPFGRKPQLSSAMESVRKPNGDVAYIEVRSTTPVDFNMMQTGQMLWRERFLPREYPNKKYVMVRILLRESAVGGWKVIMG